MLVATMECLYKCENAKSLQDMQQHLIFPDIKLLAMQLCMSGSTTYLLDLFE